MSAPVYPRSDRWSRRSGQWEAALHQIASGDYWQCRRAVGLLRYLCLELEAHVQGQATERDVSAQATDNGHALLDQLLRDFQRELSHFNARGELGDLLPLGQALLSYLAARADLEKEYLFEVPTQPARAAV